ncbi:MAG TPA: hypothetical protein DDW45_01590 [Gammaproteobacteria bacterium]|nr:hypothetical protein [Gammaproteobacteria bacterium]
MPDNAPVKILHLFVSLPVGGAENLLLSILNKLDPERFSSIVCCINKRMEVGDKMMAAGIPVIELNLLNRGGTDPNIVRELLKLIHKESIDLVHSHMYHANLYGRFAARKAGIPAIASIHNIYARQKWHRRLVNWYLARHTATITAGSEDIKRDVMHYDHVPEPLIEIIPNSVDLSRSDSALTKKEARERLGIADNLLLLGTVGRLAEQKGHRYLIDALALLNGRGIKPHLLLIGEGKEETSLKEQVAEKGLQEQIHFLGTRNDLGDLFRAMDIFVMPSLWEGLSLAMLSAMAAKLPIVATSVGGIPEVLGENEYGIVVPPADIEPLAEAIMRCVTNNDLAREIAEKGAQHVREHYSDAAMVARFQEIYEKALSA